MFMTRSTRRADGRPTRALVPLLVTVVIAMLLSTLSFAGLTSTADAAGPPYDGPQTQSEGPAFFGPAPNPFPYCQNPTYFDPFPENVNPMGSIDVTGAPNASVTTNGIDLTFELTAEGDPGGQYPGFFPGGGLGDAGDQPKGLEMASEDAGIIRLSEPLFYTQWIFTDVDQMGEGFNIAPQWTSAPGQVAIFGGDAFWDFTGTTQTGIVLDDDNGVGSPSAAIEGRVQVDLLGAVTGLDVARFPGEGQSGFAIGGGCDPIGVAKELSAPPVWNGSSFDVTYTIRVRNNLPSAATIGADIAAAQAAADALGRANTSTGAPVGIDMTALTLTDLLADDAFSTVTVVSNTATEGDIIANAAFDGETDTSLIEAGQIIAPETEATFELVLQYVPETAGPLGPDCTAVYDLLNQATVGGTADGVDVVDLSDDGTNPDPGDNNGAGETDDPTPVQFDCPPEEADPVLEIVKTVVAAGTACPAFADGVAGDGTALSVSPGDTVTYCITVNNPGSVDLTDVAVTDAMAPDTFDGAVGDLPAGTEQTVSFDLVVTGTTPAQNTASATGNGPDGPIGPVEDTALIDPALAPAIALTKTVLAGADADCTTAVEGEAEFVVGAVGDAITWCFVATNTGDVALTDVIFNDAPAGIEGLDLLADAEPPVLLVGDSIPFSLNGTITEDGAVNVATVGAVASSVEGVAIPGVPGVEDINEAAVNEAAVELNKTVVAGADADCGNATELVSVNAGLEVTYCFTITNTGGVSLRVPEVVDATLGVTIPVPAAEQDIVPGDSVTVSHTSIATGDLVNVANISALPLDPVTGEPVPGSDPLEAEDPAEIQALEANLSIVKTNVGGPTTTAGSRVPYTLLVSNAGPDEAVNVVVVDTLPNGTAFATIPTTAGWTCGVAGLVMTCTKATPLLAGESVELAYELSVPIATAAGRDLVNVTSVSSDTPDPDPSDNEDTATVTTTPPPNTNFLPSNPALESPVITNPPPSLPAPPAAPPAPPAPPLAVTGVYSGWLATAAAAMTATGGVFFVTGRRRSAEYR